MSTIKSRHRNTLLSELIFNFSYGIKKQNLFIMPTRKQISRTHLAEFRLHNGPPPGEQHEIKMLEDPAYRAAHTHRTPRVRNGRQVGTMEWDNVNKNTIPVFFNQCPMLDEHGFLVGIKTYDPKTGQMKVRFLS